MYNRTRAILVGSLVLILMLGVGLALSGQTKADGTQFEKLFGLSFPSFGTVHYNDEGLINKFTGFNLALGYSARFYNDGFVVEDFNTYWGWGTWALLIPYVEFGVSYPFVVGDKGNLLVLDLGLFYIAPRIGVTLVY